MRSLCALLLALVCLPVFAAGDCPAIQSLTASDAQTGVPVTIAWTYSGDQPASQTLTGHDFPEAIVLGPGQTSYTYTPSMPGEKHAQLAASGACGTVSRTVKYHVKQCNVNAPAIAVSSTSVAPGDVIQASVELLPGHSARWEVTNGTASATTGSSIQVTAGGAGTVTIDAWVSRGNSCSVKSTATVQVVSACPIEEPQIFTDQAATPNNWFFAEALPGPGETVRFEVHGTTIEYEDGTFIVVMTPASGSFSIDFIVSNATCSRTFTRTFTVQACTARATVSAGETGTCGATTAVAELTGWAPFSGMWSDGEYFFTMDNRIERPIAGGTHTILYFYDRYCEGPVTGSVSGGADVPQPRYTIEETVGDVYYGLETCPGVERIATLDGGIPAGSTVQWTITNGTILSGQGTAEVHYAASVIDSMKLTATVYDAQGCPSPSYSSPGTLVIGAPLVSASVQPATIGVGGTAIITTENSSFIRGMDIESSLGDAIVPIGPDRWEYRSTNGGGVATITVRGINACGTATRTLTLNIDASNPAQATAHVRAIGSGCDQWVYAQFTGTAPFSGTWSNGETFVTDEQSAFLRPPDGGTYTLVELSDANGPGTVTGEATFDFVALPQPDYTFDTTLACGGAIVTATLTEPLPPGVVANWEMNGGEIISGQGTASIQMRADGLGGVQGQVTLSGANACSPLSPHHYISNAPPPQAPVLTPFDVHVGQSTTFSFYLDPGTAATSTWSLESSLGDAIEVLPGNPFPNVYTARYTSTHGTGAGTVRFVGTNICGTAFGSTAAVQVLPPAPTATHVVEQDVTCAATITTTFTGTPPFSGSWLGEPFTTNEMTVTHPVTQSGWYAVFGLRDAYSYGSDEGVVVELEPLPSPSLTWPAPMCTGTTTTVSALSVPDGWQVVWTVDPTALRIVSGQGTSDVVVEALRPGSFFLAASYRTPEGCVGQAGGRMIDVTECPAP